MQINAHSSRSHCLLIINVVGTNMTTGVRTVGKLTLCDLAGSERINKTGATGEPFLRAAAPEGAAADFRVYVSGFCA